MTVTACSSTTSRPRISSAVSAVATNLDVRSELVRRQREIAAPGGIVVEGRDITTVVAPDADVRVLQGDALALDWAPVLAGSERWSLVANLPYNIATPLVLTLLAEVPAIERMLVMVQREVGERWAAGPGDAAYGIPSVKVALRATAEVVGRVPPTVFVPQPRVESALVRIVRRHRPAVDADPVALSRLVDAGFNQRRKMLRRSLSGLVDADGFAQAGVDPTARAETLGLEDWAALVPVAHLDA